MADAATKVTEKDVDDIFNEIDKSQNQLQPQQDVDWNEIIKYLQDGNINAIKSQISSFKINVNSQNPSNGMTLLMYAIVIGNYDLVKAICNFGANVLIKDNDGDDAIKYAISCGRYNITELIFY